MVTGALDVQLLDCDREICERKIRSACITIVAKLRDDGTDEW